MQKRIKTRTVILMWLVWLPFSGAFAGIHSFFSQNDSDVRLDSARQYMTGNPARSAWLAREVFLNAKISGDEDLLVRSALTLAKVDLNLRHFGEVITTLSYLADSTGVALPDSMQRDLFWYRGQAAYQTGYFQSAKRDFQQYYAFASKENDSAAMSKALTNLGAVCMRTGDYDESLDYNQKSLALAIEQNDTVYLSKIYNNMGGLYAYLTCYDSAMSYLQEAHKMLLFRKDTTGIIASLISMASVEREMENFTTARDYDCEAYNLDKKQAIHDYYLQILEALGLDYYMMKDYKNAEKYLQRALNTTVREKNLYFNTHIICSLVKVYMDSDRTDSAEALLKTGLAEAEQLKNKELLKLLYKSAADLYAMKGNYRLAFENLGKYHNYYDSLNNGPLRSRIKELEMNYQNDEREDEIRELQLHHNLLELKLKKDNLHKILLLSVIGFGIIVILIVIILYRNTRESKRLIQKKNDELADAVATKNRLFSIVAHDLKNPLNAIVGFSSLLTSGTNPDPEKVVRYARRIRNSGLQGFDMIEKLLEWSRLNLDDIHLNIGENDLYYTAEDACKLVGNYAETKNITIENHIQPGTTACFDKYSIESVMRNLVSNAVKYSPEKSRVDIFAELHEAHVIVRVEDHGIGIEEELQDKILNDEAIMSRAGTHNEKGSGLGLTLSREFVIRNNGEIWFQSLAGAGTTFFFSLPVKEQSRDTKLS